MISTHHSELGSLHQLHLFVELFSTKCRNLYMRRDRIQRQNHSGDKRTIDKAFWRKVYSRFPEGRRRWDMWLSHSHSSILHNMELYFLSCAFNECNASSDRSKSDSISVNEEFEAHSPVVSYYHQCAEFYFTKHCEHLNKIFNYIKALHIEY